MSQLLKTAGAYIASWALCAVAAAAPCGIYTCGGRVASILVNSSGNIYVSLLMDANALVGLKGCTPLQNDGTSFFALDSKSDNFQEMHMTILGAELMNRPVTLFLKAPPQPQLGCTVSYILM